MPTAKVKRAAQDDYGDHMEAEDEGALSNGVFRVPELKTQRVLLHVVGMTPGLIENRFSERTQKIMEDLQTQEAGSRRTKSGREPRNPQQEFEDATYRDEKGRLYVPGLWFKRSLVIAAMRFAGDKGTQAEGAFQVDEEMLYLEDTTSEPIKRTDRVVLAGQSHVTSLAYRPQFLHWSLVLPLTVVTSFISVNKVLEWAALAGQMVGVGSWRPEKKGIYGRFFCQES